VCEAVDWIRVAQDMDQRPALLNTVKLGILKSGQFLE
jgi:hypothetical protein